jgi:hypothetical protein
MQGINEYLMNDIANPTTGFLPKLLCFSDVPVENYMHGSTLLYRLLSAYPKDKLMIIEGTSTSAPDRRIRGVTYSRCEPVWSRLSRTRFHSYISPFITLSAPLQRTYLTKLLRCFEPEAVLTVVWGYSWATAAAYAERARLPLHLIVHDDSPNAEAWGAVEARVIHARLSHWYPKAASRFCASPYMADEYRRRYGAMGDVLYPSRATDAPVFMEPPDTLGQRCQPFTVAFAGTIYPQYVDRLRRMAVALWATCAGRLLVFGPTPSESVRSLLQESNIELRDRVSVVDLIRQCRREAHAMFIPMTYLEQHRLNMEIAFPSKLTDATAVGLPLIVDGPEYCSAVRWARENPGVAEVTTEGNTDGLAACLRRLQDPAHRIRLAGEAISRGNEYFASNRAISLLYSKLTGHSSPRIAR